MRWFLAALLLLSILAPLPASAAPRSLTLTRPVEGVVLRGFDDVGRYSAGHRGVDLRATPGQQVRAAAEGRVYFAGSVAGVASVSVDHGNGWRTTYLPVRSGLAVGRAVAAGEVIGSVVGGHCAQPCLHFGLTDGYTYANPLDYLAVPVIRLLPHGARPPTPRQIGAAQVSRQLPVEGRITSRFGMRVHPITGVYKLHDGADIAAACGTPVQSPLAGTVTRTEFSPAYGWRVFLDHGSGLATAYNHLLAADLPVGAVVQAGSRVGRVGSTGLSTGCHLHWMAWRDGSLIDPLTLAGAR